MSYDTNELARITGAETAPNNPLFNALRFVSRPYYAMASLFSGEPLDALENLGQMALDWPTGGFINRNFSLAKLLPESVQQHGDITDAGERPEFTTVMKRWGIRPPRSTGGRLAADLLGGVLLDPLTYLTLGTSALAKGALTGMTKGAATALVAEQLVKTKAGKDMLFRFGGDAERVMENALRQKGHAFTGFSGADAQGDLLNKGIDALESAGLVRKHGALRWHGPFGMGEGKDIAEDIWGRAWGKTLPGMAYGALRAGANANPHGWAAAGKAAADDGWNWVTSKFYDKTMSNKVSQGLQHLSRRLGFERAGADREAAELVRDLWSPFARNQREVMGQAYDDAGDAFRASGGQGANPLDDAVNRVMAQQPALDPTQVRDAFKQYQSSMDSVQQELVNLGIWNQAWGKVNYVPHQSSALLQHIMGEAIGNPVLMDSLKDVFTRGRKYADKAAFHAAILKIANKHGLQNLGLEELVKLDLGELHLTRLVAHNKTRFRTTLWNGAEKYHDLGATVQFGGRTVPVNPNVAAYVNAQFDQVGGRENFLQKIIGGGLFEVRTARGSDYQTMIKLVKDENAAARAAGKTPTWVLKDGKAHRRRRGLNYLFKPALTTHPQNVGFHFGNDLSSALMAMFDPGLGLKQGFKAFADTIRDAPILQRLAGWTPSDAGQFLRATSPDAAISAKALQDLGGKTFGGHSVSDVIGQIKQFTGRISQADIQDAIRLDELGREAVATGWKGRLEGAFTLEGAQAAAPGQATKGVGEWWVGMGEKMASHIENTHRIASYLKLIQEGVNPTAAMKRVGDVFVKYDLVSHGERALRDIFPFARFMIGSARWTEQMARRPATTGLTTIARMTGSLQDEQLLPSSVRGGIGVPWGKDKEGNMQYLTSLRLPHEAAMGVLDAVSSFEGFRRKGLGSLHPLIKAPLEQAANRNFFFGGEASAYRRKPGWLPGGAPLTEEIRRPDGTITHEVPGWLNDAIGATPASRALKIVDTLRDDRKSLADRLIRNVTGIRTVTVDQRRATAEVLERWLESRARSGQVGKINAFFSRFDEESTPEEIKIVLKSLSAFRSEKRRERKRKQR